MIKITDAKGFHMTFANGWTISVQFGSGNYSSNYKLRSFDRPVDDISSNTAEIAAWKNDKWYDFENDTVCGYLNSDEILKYMNIIAAL